MGIEEAIEAFDVGDLERAERLFREAVAVAGNDEDAACCEVYLGVIAGQKGQNDAAFDHFSTALTRDMSAVLRINAHYHAASLSCELQDFVRARKHLSEIEILAQSVLNADSMEELTQSQFLLGMALHELGNHEEALRHLGLALQRRLADTLGGREFRAQVHLWMGYSLYHLKRYLDAIHQLEQALELGQILDKANHATGRFYRALCLLELGHTEEAGACIQGLLGSDPEGSDLPAKYQREASYTLGKIYFDRQNYTQAVRFFRIAQDPSELESSKTTYLGCLLGLSLLEVGQTREALCYVKEAYEANPDDGFRAICFAKVLSALGEYPQAGAILDAVRSGELAPGVHEDLLIQKCWLYAKVGNRAKYEACYRALEVLNPLSQALLDASRTRWLPPPGTICWPGGKST